MPAKHSSEQAFETGYSPASSTLPFYQVPLPITRLIGRDHEVQQACGMLKDPKVRLLTVTGPGGVGKTRLALQAALDLQQAFEDGILEYDQGFFSREVPWDHRQGSHPTMNPQSPL